jgi:hypothetical protein
MEASRKPPSLIVFVFAEDQGETAIAAPCKYWDPARIESKCTVTERRLKSRCVGLLEIQRPAPSGAGTVQYMHRTVKDYLNSVHVWPLENKAFQYPHSALLRSYVLILKRVAPLREHIWNWTETIYECYYHARQAESTEPSYFKLLDELERAILIGRKSLYDQGAEERDFFHPTTMEAHLVPPMGISIWTGLYLYACEKITPVTFTALSPPNSSLLHYACCFGKSTNNPSAILDPRIIKHLLECGADPNLKIHEVEFSNHTTTTAWKTFLQNVFLEKHRLGEDGGKPTGGHLADRCLEVFSLFLEFGAVPSAKFSPGWRTRRHWYDAWTLLTNLEQEDEFHGTFKPEHRARV